MNVVFLLPVLLPVAAAGVARAQNCTVRLAGDDLVKYDQHTITVSASCDTIAVELTHAGELPAVSMGHNVVIAQARDVNDIARDGIVAGAANGYLKDGDPRVIAHTDLIGGGETTRIDFPGNKLTPGGDYSFFCSVPGHPPLMRGKLLVKP